MKMKGIILMLIGKKVFAPPSLLFFIGLDRRVKNISHHTLFFNINFEEHAKSIYDTPEWLKDLMF